MGCDIHCYIEYREKSPSQNRETWRDFGGRINPGRHYEIFNRLAGVRCQGEPIGIAKGMPSDCGFEARGDNLLYITDSGGDGNTTAENAKMWVQRGHSKYVDEKWVTNPDWHSHSWCSADELEAVLNALEHKTYMQEYLAILGAMRSFEQQGYYCRLVFWFDN